MKNFTMFVLLFLLSHSHLQATVIYDESISGDLPAGIKTSPTFDLSSGEYSVLGTAKNMGIDNDFDTFSINIKEGFTLEKVDYLVTNLFLLPDTDYLSTIYQGFRNGNIFGNFVFSSEILLLENNTHNIYDKTYPATGNLLIWNSGMASSSIDEGGSWNYEFQFKISPIPEPSKILLMLSGIFLLGFKHFKFI